MYLLVWAECVRTLGRKGEGGAWLPAGDRKKNLTVLMFSFWHVNEDATHSLSSVLPKKPIFGRWSNPELPTACLNICLIGPITFECVFDLIDMPRADSLCKCRQLSNRYWACLLSNLSELISTELGTCDYLNVLFNEKCFFAFLIMWIWLEEVFFSMSNFSNYSAEPKTTNAQLCESFQTPRNSLQLTS